MRRHKLSIFLLCLLLSSTGASLWAQSQNPPDKVIVPSPPRRGESDATTAPKNADYRPGRYVLPAGTIMEIRLAERVSSERNGTGDQFEAVLDRDVFLGADLVAKKGSPVYGVVLDVRDAGRVKGRARLSLELTEIEVDSKPFEIASNRIDFQAEGSKKDDVKKVGLGAAIGAAIGAIAGGKKGAAVGAAIGGGAGTTTVLVTKGKHVDLPSERLLSFRLDEDVEISIR